VIGKGSYAIVKSAQCQETKKKVAIKIYDKLKLHDPMKKKNVEREISIINKIDHPNIVKLIKTVDTSA
jgi:serine/threonine protein kinase